MYNTRLYTHNNYSWTHGHITKPEHQQQRRKNWNFIDKATERWSESSYRRSFEQINRQKKTERKHANVAMIQNEDYDLMRLLFIYVAHDIGSRGFCSPT